MDRLKNLEQNIHELRDIISYGFVNYDTHIMLGSVSTAALKKTLQSMEEDVTELIKMQNYIEAADSSKASDEVSHRSHYEGNNNTIKVKEAIRIINSGHFDSLQDAEDALGNNIDDVVARGLNQESHRYIISTNVYKLKDGKFLGIRGVSELKSEGMTYKDCVYKSIAQEYESFATTSYRLKPFSLVGYKNK